MLVVAFGDDLLTERAFARRGEPRRLVLNVETNNVEANVEVVDFTAPEALDQFRYELARDGTIVALARVKQDLLIRLEAFGLAKAIGPGLLFPPCPHSRRLPALGRRPPGGNDPGTS